MKLSLKTVAVIFCLPIVATVIGVGQAFSLIGMFLETKTRKAYADAIELLKETTQ